MVKDDLISRSALMEQLKRKKAPLAQARFTEGYNDAMLRVRSMVHSAPAVEAEPVVHARWGEYESFRGWPCTACGGYGTDRGKKPQWVRCPFCGAHMDEEVTE